MFTGLVERVAAVQAVQSTAGGRTLTIDLGPLAVDAHPGDSICVNGVCLTISRLQGSRAAFDVMGETLRVSTLGGLQPGVAVHLERALAANGRFGGHFVQGHIDGVGTVDRIERDAARHVLWVSAAPELMRLMIAKGSVAIDGVSLTVVTVERRRFSVWLIPTTLAETALGQRRVGDPVNLEADLVSKWINRRLDEMLGADAGPLTLEKLREQGFA